MPTNWDQLREFLLYQSRSGLLAQLTFRELEPFFRYAESGHYDLHRRQALDFAEVVRVISLATGDPVRRLELVSLDEPFPCAKSMTRQEYERQLQRQFCVSLIGLVSRLRVRHLQPLNQKLGNASWDSLRIQMDVCLLGQLRNALMARLMASIGVIIKDTFVGSHWESIADSLAWTVNAVLTAFVGYCLDDSAARQADIAPMVKMLKTAIPIGESTRAPGTWLILVA